MQTEYTVKACGKVNLSLNITGVQNGMHVLDSVTASVDIADTVAVRFRRDGKIAVRFVPAEDQAFAPFETQQIGENNTVTKAVLFLQRFCPDLGADVTVRKGIPLAGGLGGSSADAAAVLAAAQQALPQVAGNAAMVHECVAIGSDVPVLLHGGGVRMQGIGQQLQAVPVPVLHLAIAHGTQGVLSKDAYRVFDEMYAQKRFCPTDTQALLRALQSGCVQEIAPHLQNALERPACALCPSLSDTFAAVRDTGAAAVFLTGSGNCCCGLYESAAASAAAAAQLRRQGLFATAARAGAIE